MEAALIEPGQRTAFPREPWVDAVRDHIQEAEERDPSAWDFPTKTEPDAPPRLFQYPAMMVAEVQRSLISAIARKRTIGSIFDPFMGSGTALIEGMRLGLAGYGQDINPLSVLVARASTELPDDVVVQAAISRVQLPAKELALPQAAIPATAVLKWFRPEAAKELASLSGAIRQLNNDAVRRFMWVALAETIRLTCNSRTSTYKLHIRPADEIEALPKVVSVFEQVAQRNLRELRRFRGELRDSGRLTDGKYAAGVRVWQGDSRLAHLGRYDLLVTSPPYGDNRSTVPYGQASYLPLAWIDWADIGALSARDLLSSTHEIDAQSLGGRRAKPREDWRVYAAKAMQRSPALAQCLSDLRAEPRDRARRVAAFVADLDTTLDPILRSLTPGAPMLWTLGNRRVGGREMPLDVILEELMVSRGCSVAARLTRTISKKRMAIRNNMASTMKTETVLVLEAPAKDV